MSNDDDLGRKFEYALGIIGLSLAFTFFLYNLVSTKDVSNDLVDSQLAGELVCSGALIISTLYFSAYLVLYGFVLAGSKSISVKLLQNFFKQGVNCILSAVFIVTPILSILFAVIFYLVTSFDIFNWIKDNLIICLIIVLLFCLAVGLSRNKSKLRSGGKQELFRDLLFGVKIFTIWIIAPLFFLVVGYFGYIYLNLPNVDVSTDKVVYDNTSDNAAIIKVTAFAFASLKDNEVITVIITSQSGAEDRLNETISDKVGRGTYVTTYNLKGKEAGRYYVNVKTRTHSAYTMFIISDIQRP